MVSSRIETSKTKKQFFLDEPDKPALVRDGAIHTVFNPFRDGIWNRRQVSVGDRGPSHTTQKPSGICHPGTHIQQNEVVCDRRTLKYGNTYSRAKKIQLYGKIVSGRKYIPHSQSPLNVSIRMYIPHSQSTKKIRSYVHPTQVYV